MKRFLKALKNIGIWIKFYLWDVPTSKPEKEKLDKVKGEQVFKEYMVVQYHSQKINLRKLEYPFWKALPRKEKRTMALKMGKMEKEGKIRFEMIENKWICIKNIDYEFRIKK